MAKRVIDLILGSLFLIIGLPVMGAIAVAITLDSGGPILFRHQRLGEKGRLFYMVKFRTMKPDAEAAWDDVMRGETNGRQLGKRQDDPRLSRAGRWLRRTSMDELPQLYNVVRGEMSLVGPRPELPCMACDYKPWQRERFRVPQGMTGWWQVNGRSTKSVDEKIFDDLYYVQHYSLWLDLQILWKTVGAVVRQIGAV